MSEVSENLPLWLKTPAVPRRSRWDRAIGRLVRTRPERQRVFAFVERAKAIDRTFKIVIAVLTLGTVVILLSALPTGRYAANWVAAHGRWLALRAVGREPDREEINADWQRKRDYDMAGTGPSSGRPSPNTTRPGSDSSASPGWIPSMSCSAGGTSTAR